MRSDLCPQGHRKVGKNLLLRKIAGKFVRSCRACSGEQAIRHQRKTWETVLEKVATGGNRGRGERILPLTPRLMATLIEIYREGGCDPETYALRSLVSLETIYVMAQRLGVAGLVRSIKQDLRGEPRRRVTYECTDDGVTLVNAWLRFIQELGPVAKVIRWQER